MLALILFRGLAQLICREWEAFQVSVQNEKIKLLYSDVNSYQKQLNQQHLNWEQLKPVLTSVSGFLKEYNKLLGLDEKPALNQNLGQFIDLLDQKIIEAEGVNDKTFELSRSCIMACNAYNTKTSSKDKISQELENAHAKLNGFIKVVEDFDVFMTVVHEGALLVIEGLDPKIVSQMNLPYGESLDFLRFRLGECRLTPFRRNNSQSPPQPPCMP